MSTNPSKQRTRLKVAGIALAALVVGVGLAVVSRVLFDSAQKSIAEFEKENATATASAPATSSAPADESGQASHETKDRPATPTPTQRKAFAAQRMGMMVMLFSLMSLAFAIACVGWIVYDVRKSRPTWMTQTKYAVHVPPKKLKPKKP